MPLNGNLDNIGQRSDCFGRIQWISSGGGGQLITPVFDNVDGRQVLRLQAANRPLVICSEEHGSANFHTDSLGWSMEFEFLLFNISQAERCLFSFMPSRGITDSTQRIMVETHPLNSYTFQIRNEAVSANYGGSGITLQHSVWYKLTADFSSSGQLRVKIGNDIMVSSVSWAPQITRQRFNIGTRQWNWGSGIMQGQVRNLKIGNFGDISLKIPLSLNVEVI